MAAVIRGDGVNVGEGRAGAERGEIAVVVGVKSKLVTVPRHATSSFALSTF